MNGNYFSQNLVALRRKQGLTTGKLAQALKVTEENIVGWEMGLHQPTAKDIIKVAKYFNVDTAELANEQMFAQTAAVKTSMVKTSAVNTTNKAGALSLVMISLVMLLSVFTLISFALPCFDIDALGLIITVTFFDLLTPNNFTLEALFGWIILFILLFNIVNGIIWISSKRIRNTKYNKISQILSYSLNGLALLFWIITAIRNKDLDFKFTAIWLFVALALILGCLAFITYEYLKAVKEKVNKVKNPLNIKKFNKVVRILYIVFAAIALIVDIFCLVNLIISGNLALGAAFAVWSAILVLLMINPINQNTGARITFSIISILFSMLFTILAINVWGSYGAILILISVICGLLGSICMLCVKREKETY